MDALEINRRRMSAEKSGMSPVINNRRFSRVPIAFRARVIWEGGVFNSPKATNVSMSGIFLTTDVSIPLGTECHVVLFMVSDGYEHKVMATAKVVRQDAQGIALDFIELRGPESVANLRTLILCSAENPRTMIKEMGPEAASLPPVFKRGTNG